LGGIKLLEPRKVFTDKTGTGTSEVFTGNWYPNVTAYIKRTGGTAHSIQLQGSINGVDWFNVGSAITGDSGTNGTTWALHWRLSITSNDGTLNAWIGAGGA